MKSDIALQAGKCSDPGRERGINEDRVLVDEARGIFLVVDGLGGHAAGEMAAETAVRVVAEQIAASNGDLNETIRRAITEANNKIYELAQTNEHCAGMACVLTLAAVHDDQVTVGHVGDTRLYLVWNGNLRKVTPDHSPVGEQEDEGQLTEEEAMRHVRRNEVFRDVGSHPHKPDDPNFIDVRQMPFRQDAALLLCSDGLTDVVTSSEIKSIIDRYDGDPDATARELVQEANRAGGTDNISVIFVPGPEFPAAQSSTLAEARSRHAETRPKKQAYSWRRIAANAAWLLAGMILGMLLWAALDHVMPRRVPASYRSSPHFSTEKISENGNQAIFVDRVIDDAAFVSEQIAGTNAQQTG
ncbi:MAG: serine/threonine-protein phosphatase [Acidobacteriaceae bacterium]|nr:serine/threonine-protein phosphatase [Acidobacteriaceae bacterium]